mmetsp:Transcript_10768/g.21389  ORF Transcript_10768/g.21389 Transcript_10768/m.21389 type:complete len:177 (+) Transcript_10768:1126-1656(+)
MWMSFFSPLHGVVQRIPASRDLTFKRWVELQSYRSGDSWIHVSDAWGAPVLYSGFPETHTVSRLALRWHPVTPSQTCIETHVILSWLQSTMLTRLSQSMSGNALKIIHKYLVAHFFFLILFVCCRARLLQPLALYKTGIFIQKPMSIIIIFISLERLATPFQPLIFMRITRLGTIL